jgi:hypothetical protein
MLLGRMWVRTACALVALALVTVRLAPVPRAAQRVDAPPAPADDETRRTIRQLKLQALDAQAAQDLKKELEVQRKILRLDPDDSRALQRSSELLTAIQKEDADAANRRVVTVDQTARLARIQEALTAAENALVEFRTSTDAELLDRAQRQLEAGRKLAQPTDPPAQRLRFERLQAEIDQDRSTVFRDRVEFWGLIGVAVAALLMGLFFYVRRRGRVLEIVQGPQIGQTFTLEKQETAVGALASEVDWAIEDPLRKISRRHCDVVRQGRHYFLVDLSLNGTFLNGRPLQKGQPALLKRGDHIGLGGEVTLLFR